MSERLLSPRPDEYSRSKQSNRAADPAPRNALICMLTDYEIRRAERRDIGTLTSLFDGYRRFYEQEGDLAGCRRFLEERFRMRDSRILIAVDGAGSGLGFTQLYPTFSSVRMRSAWILNDLFVAEQARGHGVAERLMNEARHLASDSGVAMLVLETARDNAAARSLYEKLGWKRVTEFDRYELELGH